MSTTKFLAGALAGITTGLVIGVLVAPDSGNATRKKIKNKADGWRKKVNGLLGKGTDELSDLRDVFEHEISGLEDDVRERVLKLINKSQGTYDRFKQEVLS
ncbi:YtxH domain-containing protein [Chitinophaga nivalis]|uniref:YtxH domain-containing protein n=1 Tax=Chitinophaga nivalis TaxID=2991709 RepID=A0ABT3IPZ0_9BACT|nr:YtxH domain-containing protein [Chitinophaga nivalis]MCW3464264.1 YtxH domain-containing protein [Chitinophaga nivalis]MCW3486045.1 YtxH domain-containing protein [Chitinophaga nivalis]